MNLYEVSTKVQVGRSSGTHFNISPTFHVSAASAQVAANKGEMKGVRWAQKEYKWFLSGDDSTPVRVEVVAVKLLDEDWE